MRLSQYLQTYADTSVNVNSWLFCPPTGPGFPGVQTGINSHRDPSVRGTNKDRAVFLVRPSSSSLICL